MFFTHSSVEEHLDCFHALAIISSALMNIGVHMLFWIMVFSRYIPSSDIAGLYDSTIFSFLRKLHTVFPSGFINLNSHQQGFLFSTSLPAIVKSHPNRFETISHCHFDPSATFLFSHAPGFSHFLLGPIAAPARPHCFNHPPLFYWSEITSLDSNFLKGILLWAPGYPLCPCNSTFRRHMLPSHNTPLSLNLRKENIQQGAIF